MSHFQENKLPFEYSLVDTRYAIASKKQIIYISTNHPNKYQTYLNIPSSPCANNASTNSNYHNKVEPVLSSLHKSTWIAYASLSPADSKYLSEFTIEFGSSQTVKPDSQAVRLLLERLLSKLGLSLVSEKNLLLSQPDQTYLDETVFPYRLQPQGYYVCFSHSQPIVACTINIGHPIGIDVEMRDIPLSVAKRFYHPDEVSWLNRQSSTTQKLAIKFLWMIKEAYIKQQGLPTLMHGLKINQLNLVKQLLVHLMDNDKKDLVKLIDLKSQSLLLSPYLYKEINLTCLKFNHNCSVLIYFSTPPIIVLK